MHIDSYISGLYYFYFDLDLNIQW